MPEEKVLLEAKYEDLHSLICILMDSASAYFDNDDDGMGLTLGEFLEWLEQMAMERPNQKMVLTAKDFSEK